MAVKIKRATRPCWPFKFQIDRYRSPSILFSLAPLWPFPASPVLILPSPKILFIPQRFNRIEPRRLPRRIVSEENPHSRRKYSRGNNGFDRDQSRPGQKIADQRRTDQPEQDPNRAAQ